MSAQANGQLRIEQPLRSRRSWVVLLLALGWTLIVGMALWWLLHSGSGPSVWVLRDGDAARPEVRERIRDWFKSDLGLQRAYPWLLFGPYVALIAWYFPLERRQLPLHLTLNMVAAIGFVAGAQWLNTRTNVMAGKVVFFKAEHSTGIAGTNTMEMRIVRQGSGDFLGEGLTQQPIVHRARTNNSVSGTGNGFEDRSDETMRHGQFAKFGPAWSEPFPSPNLPKLRLLSVVIDLVAYAAVLGLMHSVQFYRRFRARERDALVLESKLAQAQLNALRAQLQPHFLFNSLNAVTALLKRAPTQAEAALVSLSELLRLTLSQSERQQVSLREEMQLIDRYLGLQRTRFGERLRVEQTIEPDALDCLVPTLLLQPVVENAIRHGIEPTDYGGLLRISAARQGERLVITVEDDGAGLKRGIDQAPRSNGSVESSVSRLNPEGISSSVVMAFAPPATEEQDNGAGLPASEQCKFAGDFRTGTRGNGIGLKNLRARLQALYGNEQALTLGPGSQAGAMVRIEIPWQAGDNQPCGRVKQS